MIIRPLLCATLLLAALTFVVQADEPTPENAAASETELTPEAQAIAEQLRATLPADSEAIAMLDHILQGSTLSGNDGWFPLAKAQTRFGWEQVLSKFNKNDDQAIESDEFSGSAADFDRLDRNGDQQITAADFDWSEHSLSPTPGRMMFFMADRDANGKLTKAEFSGLFEQLGGSNEEFLALDDLAGQFMPPPADARERRADRPSRSTLVAGLKNQEIGSLQPGPQLDEPAPDFTLTSLSGEPVRLSQEIGEKPIVLIFGNFTCGPFRSQAGNLEKLYERYQDRAKFFLVYVREAHPSDGWWMMSNQRVGIDLEQPQDNAGRRSVAASCQQHLGLEIPFLVDTVDDQVGAMYSGMPNRLYLIDQQGRIAFKNGRGPFGFHPRQLEQALILLLNDQ